MDARLKKGLIIGIPALVVVGGLVALLAGGSNKGGSTRSASARSATTTGMTLQEKNKAIEANQYRIDIETERAKSYNGSGTDIVDDGANSAVQSYNDIMSQFDAMYGKK